MSAHESNDLQVSGYFMSEESQQRLARLSEHIDFLSRLAQPRTRDEELDAAPEIAMAELATCLALLAEQVDLVVEAAVWRPGEHSRARATEPGAAAALAASDATSDGDTDERFSFGVTLEQLDAFERAVERVAAHGDVLASGGATELDDRTLPVLGQAILDAADVLRTLRDQIEAQPLAHWPDVGVREPRASYDLDVSGATATELRLH